MTGIAWSNELLDCSMPVRMDTYRICSYGCLYCFSRFHPKRRDSKRQEIVNVDKITKLFTGATYSNLYSPLIKARKFIQWGGLSDPFDENERKHGVTLELLKMFKKLNYPLSFSTKGTWWVYDDRYRKIIEGQKNWYFKVSIITNDEDIAKNIEPGVDGIRDRIKAIKEISKFGAGEVALRFRPFIIGISDREGGHKELIRKCAKAGAKAISTEFLCLEARANDYLKGFYGKIKSLAGYDIYEWYRRNSITSGLMRLSRELKRKPVMEMYETATANGMRFYCSDQHWKDLNYNGSCCGLPEKCNYNKAQFTEMICRARDKGKVTIGEFDKEFIEEYKEVMIEKTGINLVNSENIAIKKTQSIYDYFREKWNDLRRHSGLMMAYGRVLKPIEVKDKNVVFKYNGELTK